MQLQNKYAIIYKQRPTIIKEFNFLILSQQLIFLIIYNMEKEQINQQQTKYTIVPIKQKENRKRLQTYFNTPHEHPKSSFCRFYLRGLCIVKPQICKFAHSFDELKIQEDDQDQIIKNYLFTQKQRKKKYFAQRIDFQQKSLFVIRNLGYHILYAFQFEQKWKNSKKNNQIHSLEQISANRQTRVKIRQVLHRQNWDKLIKYLQYKYPGVDYPISFLSKWFSKVGFQKPQTKCKFGDFMRFMIFVQGYKEVNIIIPPRIEPTIFFINCKQTAVKTYLHSNVELIEDLHLKAKQQYKKILEIKAKPLPNQFDKKYVCRYYMAGNCQLTSFQCNYAHSIKELKFVLGQPFPPEFKQKPKSSEERANYLSLYRFSMMKGKKNIKLEDLNNDSFMRAELRKKMHLQLYSDFLNLLIKETGQSRLKKSQVEKQYNGAGFNHSQNNKFGQFYDYLWDLGYSVYDAIIQPQNTKCTYIYPIPPTEELDNYYRIKINQALDQQLEKTQKNNVEKVVQSILQSSLRKAIYRYYQNFTIPLHIYLKIKNKSFQEVLKLLISQEKIQFIFFETGQQNYRKLIQITKKYFKTSKKYLHKFDDIELYIKNQHKQEINLNGFVNFRGLLQSAILDMNKKIYFFPFGQNIIVVDKLNIKSHQKFVQNQFNADDIPTKLDQINELKSNKFFKQRIVTVDNLYSLYFAKQFLSKCNKFGVDLQGRLRKEGYIDLIQVSSIFQKVKQIFVFDIFYMKNIAKDTETTSIIYQQTAAFLKNIFQDKKKVKILHDCKQDSVALKYLMNIQINNVFDTSGMNMYLEQKQIYQTQKPKKNSNHHFLKLVFQVKVPGLNVVLERWEAPNGVNIFKESMKKLFHQQGTRKYFQQRPIDPQFLQYSVQDVQDLIQVYQKMKAQDDECLSELIGQIYSKNTQ